MKQVGRVDIKIFRDMFRIIYFVGLYRETKPERHADWSYRTW